MVQQYNKEDDLTLRCKETIKFLKKTTVHKDSKVRLSDLPAYLLIGPSRAGKTTLLVKSNLKFLLEKKINSPENIESTNNYDWWMTSKSIIIDTPGNYFASSQNKRKDRYIPFLKTLQKLHYKRKIKGILITLSITDVICQDHYIKLFYENVQQQLANILNIIGWHVPIFLIVNKCDLISGFQEFFSDLSREERFQIWGFPISSSDHSNKFDKEFDRLIHRLNNQIINKLQYEKLLDKRILINNFPFQMSHLKSYLQDFITYIFEDMPHLKLKGLFLTSGAQQQSIVEHKKEIKQCNDKSKALIINIKPFFSRAFFIHDLLDGFILSKIPHTHGKMNANLLLRPIIYSVAGILIFLCALGLSIDFNHQIKTINTAQKAIALYQVFDQNNHKKSTLDTRLESLEALNLAVKMLSDTKHSTFSLLLPNNRNIMNQLRNNISITYDHALQTSLLPKILDQLTNILTAPATQPPLLYKTLKSYLMITHHKRFDPNDVVDAMQQFWEMKYPQEVRLKLSKHVLALLTNSTHAMPVNQKAIKYARTRLAHLKPMDRAYIILGNEINNQPLLLNLQTNKLAASVFTFVEKNPIIPSIYTANHFSTIYPNLIKKVSKEAILGNWVTGTIRSDSPQLKKQIDHLNATISKRYLQNYAKTWLNLLDNIRIIHFTQLNKMIAMLNIIGDNHSPLVQLIELIQSNLPKEVMQIDPRLKSFNDLNQQGSIKKLTQALHDLDHYLSPLNTTKNLDQTAFKLTSVRMRNAGKEDALTHLFAQVQTYPEPIKNWVYDICVNTWQLLLYQTQNYIEHIWETDIVPQYQAQLENRFPFAPTASEEASLESFTYFFAPNSLIDNFFNNYLTPFINSANQPWTLKHLDGGDLQLAQKTIDFFQKVYEIQHVYFPNMSRKPMISFTMQPIYIEGNLDLVTLALGSQQMNYRYGQPFIKEEFAWPDYIDSNVAKIVFTDKQGSKTELSDEGPWALLKLLQSSGLHFTKEPFQYAAQFHTGDYSMIVNIETKTQNNPFLLERFAQLSFPIEL